MKPAAILLDVDGTLYHASPVRLGVVSMLLMGHASAPISGLRTGVMLWAYRRTQEQLRRGEHPAGRALAAAQLELSSRLCGATPAAMERVVRRWMEEEPRPLLRWAKRRGLHAFLDAARARGIKLGVVSDYPAVAKLESMQLRSYFDVVVSAQDADVQRFKPDPRGILHALERLGVAPEHAVYVGDRAEVDMIAADRAGVRGILLRGPLSIGRPGAHDVADYDALHARLFSGDSRGSGGSGDARG